MHVYYLRLILTISVWPLPLSVGLGWIQLSLADGTDNLINWGIHSSVPGQAGLHTNSQAVWDACLPPFIMINPRIHSPWPPPPKTVPPQLMRGDLYSTSTTSYQMILSAMRRPQNPCNYEASQQIRPGNPRQQNDSNPTQPAHWFREFKNVYLGLLGGCVVPIFNDVGDRERS